MLPPPVENAIRAVAADRTSGASRLGRQTLDAMALMIAQANGHPNPADLSEAARRLSSAQPAMAIVHNVAHLVARLVAEGQDPQLVLDGVREELDGAREKIARNFLKIAPDRGTIVTLSHSDNALEAIKAAHARGLVERVFVLESKPLLEGLALAKALSEAGVPTKTVPDDVSARLLRDATYVLVGADSVLRDGSVVNKIGTYRLASTAANDHKPVYVVCETLKFDARYDAVTWPGSSLKKDEKQAEASVLAGERFRDFEVTPAQLVTMIATERGAYGPDTIRIMLTPRPKD